MEEKTSTGQDRAARTRRGWLPGVVLAASAGLTFWALAAGPARVFPRSVIALPRPVLAGEVLRIPVAVRWEGPGPLVIDKLESS